MSAAVLPRFPFVVRGSSRRENGRERGVLWVGDGVFMVAR